MLTIVKCCKLVVCHDSVLLDYLLVGYLLEKAYVTSVYFSDFTDASSVTDNADMSRCRLSPLYCLLSQMTIITVHLLIPVLVRVTS